MSCELATSAWSATEGDRRVRIATHGDWRMGRTGHVEPAGPSGLLDFGNGSVVRFEDAVRRFEDDQACVTASE